MIKRVVCSTLPLLLRTSKFTILRPYTPTYLFVKMQKSQSLSESAAQQIKYEQQNPVKLDTIKSYFQQQGWSINYDGLFVQLSKKNGSHNLKLLFAAKSPFEQSAPQGQNTTAIQDQNQQNEQMDGAQLVQLTAFINKDGKNRWLVLDFLLSKTNETHLNSAFFINDYQKQKLQRKTGQITQLNYNGPIVETLDQNLQNGLFHFIQNIGFTSDLLSKASQFSVLYEHHFYLQWLKDLKDIA